MPGNQEAKAQVPATPDDDRSADRLLELEHYVGMGPAVALRTVDLVGTKIERTRQHGMAEQGASNRIGQPRVAAPPGDLLVAGWALGPAFVNDRRGTEPPCRPP